MAARTARRILKPAMAAGALVVLVSASAGNLEPPPFNVINRHHVNMMSGTAAPKFTDVSIGGDTGLSHWVTTANSDFVNFEAGYGPLGPRDKFFGRVVKAIHHKPSANMNTWVTVMRAVSFDGSHEFTINAGCTRDSAGNTLTYNTFTSYDQDPRHLLEYTSDKAGLIWTRPDGTRVFYTAPFSVKPGSCFTAPFDSELQGYGIARVEYPNGFTITGGSADNIMSEVRTNTGFQLTYVYVKRQEPDRNYGAPSGTQPWAPQTWDIMWSTSVPTYVVAINNTIDYCAAQQANFFGSLAEACPGLTRKWPFATYNWPVGMPRVAYLTDRTTTFTITDAMGLVTRYVHKPFRSTGQSTTEWYVPRLYQVQSAASDVADITYNYSTSSTGIIVGDEASTMYPIYVSGPAALLKDSNRNGTDAIGYSIGWPYGRGGASQNGSGGADGNLNVITNFTFGTASIDMWDKTFTFEQQQSNRLSSIQRKIDGVLVVYGYDTRYNINKITEYDKPNGKAAVTQTAGYPLSCDASTRKTCNQPEWTRDALGNETDYEYDANSGQVTRIRMPADRTGVRPEFRYEYQAHYAFYKRSAGGAVERGESPIYLLAKERKCMTGAMNPDGSCAKGASDAAVTDYDYGPDNGAGNNLLLRGVAVTAYANGASQTRRTCYSYDIYGNRIGETRPQAGLASCN